MATRKDNTFGGGLAQQPSDYASHQTDLAALVNMQVNAAGEIENVREPRPVFTVPQGMRMEYIHKTPQWTHYILRKGTELWYIDAKDVRGQIVEALLTKICDLADYVSAGSLNEIYSTGKIVTLVCSNDIVYCGWFDDEERYAVMLRSDIRMDVCVSQEDVLTEYAVEDGDISYDASKTKGFGTQNAYFGTDDKRPRDNKVVLDNLHVIVSGIDEAEWPKYENGGSGTSLMKTTYATALGAAKRVISENKAMENMHLGTKLCCVALRMLDGTSILTKGDLIQLSARGVYDSIVKNTDKGFDFHLYDRTAVADNGLQTISYKPFVIEYTEYGGTRKIIATFPVGKYKIKGSITGGDMSYLKEIIDRVEVYVTDDDMMLDFESGKISYASNGTGYARIPELNGDKLMDHLDQIVLRRVLAMPLDEFEEGKIIPVADGTETALDLADYGRTRIGGTTAYNYNGRLLIGSAKKTMTPGDNVTTDWIREESETAWGYFRTKWGKWTRNGEICDYFEPYEIGSTEGLPTHTEYDYRKKEDVIVPNAPDVRELAHKSEVLKKGVDVYTIIEIGNPRRLDIRIQKGASYPMQPLTVYPSRNAMKMTQYIVRPTANYQTGSVTYPVYKREVDLKRSQTMDIAWYADKWALTTFDRLGNAVNTDNGANMNLSQIFSTTYTYDKETLLLTKVTKTMRPGWTLVCEDARADGSGYPISIEETESGRKLTIGGVTYETNYEDKETAGLIRGSEADNPFVFPANNAMMVGTGKVLRIVSNTEPISQGQFGQHPLIAATDEGLWALGLDAEGKMRTSDVIVRDNVLSKDGVAQLDKAIVYASVDGVKLLQGGQVMLLSSKIDGTPETLSGMPMMDKVARLQGLMATTIDRGYLRDYLRNCKITQDYIGSRIVLYSPTEDYAYSYSTASKTWSTLTEKIDRNLNQWPACWVVQKMEDGTEVVSDMWNDDRDNAGLRVEPMKGLMMTRPMSWGEPDILKRVEALMLRGNHRRENIKMVLWGTRDGRKWYHVANTKGDKLRNVTHGSPYKQYRLAVLSDMGSDETITGMTADLTAEGQNKMR